MCGTAVYCKLYLHKTERVQSTFCPCDLYCCTRIARQNTLIVRQYCSTLKRVEEETGLAFASCSRDKSLQLRISYSFILKVTDVAAVAFSAGRGRGQKIQDPFSPHSVLPFSLCNEYFSIPYVSPSSHRITFSSET